MIKAVETKSGQYPQKSGATRTVNAKTEISTGGCWYDVTLKNGRHIKMYVPSKEDDLR